MPLAGLTSDIGLLKLLKPGEASGHRRIEAVTATGRALMVEEGDLPAFPTSL